jgi:hypothetical protein
LEAGFSGKSGGVSVSIPSIALVISGILLVFLGLFAAGELIVVGLGIVALIAAGLLEVMAVRRR